MVCGMYFSAVSFTSSTRSGRLVLLLTQVAMMVPVSNDSTTTADESPPPPAATSTPNTTGSSGIRSRYRCHPSNRFALPSHLPSATTTASVNRRIHRPRAKLKQCSGSWGNSLMAPSSSPAKSTRMRCHHQAAVALEVNPYRVPDSVSHVSSSMVVGSRW